MQALTQSFFLQSLAYELINSIWQMGLLWVVTIFVLRFFKFSSAQKFNIAFAAQLTGFVIFLYCFLHAYTVGLNIKTVSVSSNGEISNYIGNLMPYVSVLYLTVLGYELFKLAVVYRSTQNLRSLNLKKIAPAYRIFVSNTSQLFSLHKKVKIFLSEKITCPLTIGFFKPVILIPFAAINHLTTEQMEAVILHELAHIKRADYLLFLVQSLIEKLFFFNIFSKMLGDIMDRERENACDDWVVQFKYNSFHYAEALLKLGRLQSAATLAMAASGSKQNVLLARIKRLIHRSEQNIVYNINSLRLSFLTLIMAMVTLASFQTKYAKEEPSLVAVKHDVFIKEASTPKILLNEFRPVVVRKAEPGYEIKVRSENSVATTTRKNTTNKINALTDDVNNAVLAEAATPQQYFVEAKQNIDSLTQILPSYNEALNQQLVLNQNQIQQLQSYENFKQIEKMLAYTGGDSLHITESNDTQDSYKKLITIETIDKTGNKHVYTVVIELYQ